MRNSVLSAKLFTRSVGKYVLPPSLSIENIPGSCINWCLFKTHMSKCCLSSKQCHTLQRFVAYIEEWCSLCNILFTHVVCFFSSLSTEKIWHELVPLKCTFLKDYCICRGKLLQRCRAYTFLKKCCTHCEGLLHFLFCYFYLLFMFVLVKSLYLCMTWESYWAYTVVAFVAEATMFGFGQNRV